MTTTLVAASQITQGQIAAPVVKVIGDSRGRVNAEVVALGIIPGDLAVSIEEGGVLRTWNLKTGEQVRSAAMAEFDNCWAISSASKIVASGGTSVNLWDGESSNHLGRFSDTPWTECLAFSHDGQLIASGHEDGAVRIWNVTRGSLVTEIRAHEDEVCAVAFSLDGAFFVSAGEDRVCAVWDLKTGEPICRLTGHTDRVDALAWSPNGELIASASWDTSVRLWNAKTGNLVSILNGQGECVHCVVFSSDGKLLFCGDSDGCVRIWNFEKLKVERTYHGHFGPVKRIDASQDGRWLVTGGMDRLVQIWDTQRGECVIDPSEPTTSACAVSVVADDRLATVYANGQLVVWDIARGEAMQDVSTRGNATSLAGQVGSFWVCGWRDGSVSIYNRYNDTVANVAAHRLSVRCLGVHPTQPIFASSIGTDGSVLIANATNGQPLLMIPLAIDQCSVEVIAFHPTKPILAVAGINLVGKDGSEGLISLWDYETKTRVLTIPSAASNLAFHPSGTVLAFSNNDESVCLVNLASSMVVEEIPLPGGVPTSIAFSRDGKWLAGSSEEGAIRIWAASNWRLAAAFDLETRVRAIDFDRTSRFLFTGNENSTCYMLDLSGLANQ